MSRDGLLIVDKPAGWTSHDVVGRTRRLAQTRRVGHAGTLDPMATGVLVLGVNRATKLLTFLVGCDKEYTATIRLGATTITDDAEGDVITQISANHLGDEQISTAIAALTGDLQQVPSSVSAIKVNGQRSYARVRGGEDVTLAPRAVRVSRFAILERRDVDSFVDLHVVVEVSSGTYVRALARDLGAALRVGGHLTALRRTRVGDFTVSDAHTMDQLIALREQGETLPILPMAAAARAQFPVRELTEEQSRKLRFGQLIEAAEPPADTVAGIDPTGELIAILDQSGAIPKSRVVFPPGD